MDRRRRGQAYFGPLTLYGQAAYLSSTTDSGWLSFDGYFLRGSARYYATPNFSLATDIVWTSIDGIGGGTTNADALTLIGTAEYRFNNMPLSGFGRVRWDRVAVDPGMDSTSTQLLLGIRAYFGTPTLLDNERRGVPFDVVPFPPSFALNLG